MKIESSWSHIYFKPLIIVANLSGCLRPFNKKKLICFSFFLVAIALPSYILSFWKPIGCLFIDEPELRNRNISIYINFLFSSLVCAICSLLGLVYFPKKLSKLLETYDRLRADPIFEIQFNRSRKIMKIYISITFCLVIFAGILVLFGNAPFVEANCLNVPLFFRSNPILLWLGASFASVQTVIVFLQRFAGHGFILFLTNIVIKEFTRLNMEFEKLLTSTVTVHRLEIIRKRYFDICDFVAEIDDAFLSFVSVYLMNSLITICLDIHALFYGFLSHIEVIAYCGIVGIAVFEVILILVNGGLIASKSKGCFETCKRFNMNKLDPETMSAFVFLLENMKNADAGLSFLKLFIVDKAAMLTITGTLISYIVVVLQMKPT